MKYFIEIYYSSFSGKTTYSKPKDIRYLAKTLALTEWAGTYLKTIAIVTFRWKQEPHETYRDFHRLDFIKDRDKINELIGRGEVHQQVLELK